MKFAQYQSLRGQLLEKARQGDRSQGPPSTLALAWLGDGVFSLYVRERLLAAESNKVRVLNDVGAAVVSAVMQAKALKALLPDLTEEERAVVRRGRNSKTAVPRSASMAEYRHSTALESLLGWLYWQGRHERLEIIMAEAFAQIIRHLEEAGENGGLIK